MEPIKQADVVLLDDPSQLAEIRRAARSVSARLGLGTDGAARVELVAMELANNILQHARSSAGRWDDLSPPRVISPGRLLFSSAATVAPNLVQIVAIDSGPGLASTERAFEDGYSTRSTPGLGLGAVRRQSATVDLFSMLGAGTVVSALVGAAGPDNAPEATPAIAVLSTALHGEQLSGDSWAVFHSTPGDQQRDLYLLVDGLGHGLYASEAAAVAINFFLAATRRDPDISLTHLLEQMHPPMRGTRGAAVAIVSLEPARRRAVCCGVGNISCALHAPNGTVQSMVSHNGTIGHQMRRVQEFEYRYDKGALLILHSDGLSTHWKLAQYPGLAHRAPATIAGVLYRDAARGRDDATILVSRLD